MFDHFLTYRTEIPNGLGWEHYGPVHLTYLIGFALACVILALVYRRGSKLRRRRIQITYAVIVVALEVVKQILCLVTGVYEPGLVPLHLCGMTIFIIVIHTARANRWTAEILYSLCLPGAIAALLFSDWNMYPIANFYCQQSFFIHFFEFSYPVLLLASGELRPRLTQIWRPALYLAIFTPPVYFFNKAFDTNFFFINTAAANSPLSFLQNLMGNPGYLFGYVGLVLVVWLLLYLPWAISDQVKKRRGIRKREILDSTEMST